MPALVINESQISELAEATFNAIKDLEQEN